MRRHRRLDDPRRPTRPPFDGRAFTQAEPDRIVAREKREAAEKAKADADEERQRTETTGAEKAEADARPRSAPAPSPPAPWLPAPVAGAVQLQRRRGGRAPRRGPAAPGAGFGYAVVRELAPRFRVGPAANLAERLGVFPLVAGLLGA